MVVSINNVYRGNLFQSKFHLKYRVVIDRAIGYARHGKYLVDTINCVPTNTIYWKTMRKAV